MRRFLSFISTKFFWVLLGLISISLLVWFVGPIISIGEYKPFAKVTVRVIIISSIFILWIGKILLTKYIQLQRNKVLVEEIKSSQEPILKHVKKDSSISKQFEEIDTALKSANFTNSNNFINKYFKSGQYLYQMPWYVVMGAAGTGKTTVLKESGLNFPLESSFGASISGLVGTKDCDWFLTDDAVLLDTAGRLSLHENGEEDTYDWLEFIGLLKRYRPKQPINGVVITVSLEDLLDNEVDFRNLAKELRKRIHEMRAKFGIDFPVYLVITKLDMLKGFNEFFHQLTESDRNKSLGFTIPESKNVISRNNNETASDLNDIDLTETIGFVSKNLKQIEQGIEASYLKVINNLENKDDKNAVFAFSNEFSELNNKLMLLFKELYKSSKFESNIQWRGIYFTSATQNGTNIDPVFDGLKNDFQLVPKYINNSVEQPKNTKSFFVHNLFKEVIFSESNLASKDKAWSQKHRLYKLLGVGGLILSGIAYSGFMFNSYLVNSEYLDNVNNKVVKIDSEMKSITATKDLLQAVELADKIKTIPLTNPFLNVEDPALKHRLGLYQGKTVNNISQAAYNRVLRESVMPLISYTIDDLLRNSSDNSSIDTYNALKAYLMLYDDSKFDSKFMLNLLIKNFEKNSAIQNAEQKKKVTDALKLILDKEGLTPSLPLDTDLISRKRQIIATSDLSEMILNDTFFELSNIKVSPVSFDTMGGKQSRLIFTRISGKPITEAINPLYTKQAYMEFVLPELLKSTAKLYAEEEWVLGSYSSLKSSQAETLEEAKRVYFTRYISEWNSYISDIKLKQPSNLREARDIAKILSDSTSSPLSNLVKGISENTTLNIKRQLDDKGEMLDSNLIERLVSKAGLGRLQNSASNIEEKYLNTLKFDTLVDEEFNEFHQLTEKNDSNQAVINDVILSIKDLYEYLDVLSIAVEKGIDIPSNDSLFKYRAEINRLPSPFRQMFDRFSIYVLNESLDELNERLQNAKLEEQLLEEQKKRELEEEKQAQTEAELQLKKKQESDIFNSMKNRLIGLNSLCKSSLTNRYPFASVTSEVPLVTFNKLFGANGQYFSLMTLSPEMMNLTNTSNFNEFVRSDPRYLTTFKGILNVERINSKYFVNNTNNAGFDFDLEFVVLNPEIDTVIFEYGGKRYEYSHGPIMSYDLKWPLSKNSATKLTAFVNNKSIGSIREDGAWGLFRFLESANTTTHDNMKTLAKYSFNGKEVILKFTPKANNNPFVINDLRRFSCP